MRWGYMRGVMRGGGRGEKGGGSEWGQKIQEMREAGRKGKGKRRVLEGAVNGRGREGNQ